MHRYFLYISQNYITFQNGLYDHLLKFSNDFDELVAFAIYLLKTNTPIPSFKPLFSFQIPDAFHWKLRDASKKLPQALVKFLNNKNIKILQILYKFCTNLI